MLVFKILFVSGFVLWTSECFNVQPTVQQYVKNGDNTPEATFPVIQQFYHTDEQIANLDVLDLFKSLNPNIQVGSPDLLVSTTNQEKKATTNKEKEARTDHQNEATTVKINTETKKPNEELSKFYQDFLRDIKENRYLPLYEGKTEETTTPKSENLEKSETKLQPEFKKLEPERKKSKRRKSKHVEEPLSYHENPGEIPTKPIYPGPGQWARKNLKHRPHITKHNQNPQRNRDNHQPQEGKEIFDQNKEIFKEEKEIHQQNLNDEESHNIKTQEFIPYRNYAQVRKTETKQRMPKRKRKKGKRLKESIKDSKVHTIYTEEGYEDSAYDHGEQEKNAKRKETEKTIEEETETKHDLLPTTKEDDIPPEPPTPPAYHEEQTQDDEEEEKHGEETRTTKNKENHRGLDKEEVGVDAEDGNKQKRHDGSAEEAEKFDVKIDEAKYPESEEKIEENKEDDKRIEEESPVMENKKKNIEKTTTAKPKRNIFNEDWFQQYKFDNIGDYYTDAYSSKSHKEDKQKPEESRNFGDYYTDAYSSKNHKEDKQKPEESQDAPREVVDVKIADDTVAGDKVKDDEVEDKEGDSGKKRIVDQDWFQKYRLNNWKDYVEPVKKPTKPKSDKDNVKHRNQDQQYDAKKQTETFKGPENSDSMSESDQEIKIYINNPNDQETTEEKLIDTMVSETRFGERIKKNNRNRRSTQEEKFPFYNSKDLDTASSLRYAENFNNIPEKKKGVMTFYDKADKIECPETTEVNPVPAKEANETNSPEKPRLDGRLGDQIDCMKSKYFGENPLDNPLFAEEDVEVPTSIFNKEEYEYYDDVEEEEEDRQPKSNDDKVENNSTETLPKAEQYIRRRKVVKKRRRYPVYPPREYRRKYYRPSYQPSHQPSHQLNYQPSHQQTHQLSHQTSYEPSHQPEPMYNLQINHPVESGINPINGPTKQFSEVHYKEEIKPSEQLNVFADIINNIKHSNEDSASQESGVEEITIVRKPTRNKHRYFASTSTTRKPFLPTPIQDNEDVRYKKRIPSNIFPEHKDADEIIIVKKPPMLGNFKPYFPKDVDNLVDYKNQEQPSNHQVYHNHHPTPPSVDEIRPHDNLEITTNNYFFLGMRPPPEFPYTHPIFYNSAPSPPEKKRRNSKPKRRRRVKRSENNRRGYAEISRGSNQEVKSSVEEEDEDDDYVPHRPKTFHYDEETGKIVYDKKPEEPVEYEEVEYVEVEEETTHPPKKKKKPEPKRFPPTPPPGPSYLDFIKVLKSNANYTLIEDPKPKEATTTTARTITSPSGIPEFLQILSKVKSDKTYEVILDPTPEPKKKKTTTTEPPEEPELEESEEVQEVQNSPGVQGILGFKSALQVFDISEFVPKTRDYSPRTSIDTSKYTNIKRNHPKPVEIEEEPLAEKVVMEEIVTTTQASRTIEIPTTSVRSTTPYEEETTTKVKRVVLRGRRRSTTPRTTLPERTPKTAPETTVKPERKQRGRSRYRSTTASTPLEETVRNRRNLHPRNHRREYADTRNDIANVLRVKPTPRSITLNIINQINRTNLIDKTNQLQSTTKAPTETNQDVEVFGDYDKDKKHGGNYKYKKVQIRITSNYKPINEESVDSGKGVVEKDDEYFKDEQLPTQVNGLKEKKYERTETIFEEEDDMDNHDFFDDTTTEETSTKKLPNIIKDPSKRLYFYAPV